MTILLMIPTFKVGRGAEMLLFLYKIKKTCKGYKVTRESINNKKTI